MHNPTLRPRSRFGALTVLHEDYTVRQRKYTRWVCQCDCGAIVKMRGDHLIDGKKRSCGCGSGPAPKHTGLENKRFGRLVAIKELPDKKWLCQCDCGQTKIANPYALQRGAISSCGCLRSAKKWLGCSDPANHPLFPDWQRMALSREPVIESWLESFYVFALCTQASHTSGATLERPDPNAPWGPNNYRWRIDRG